MKDTVVYHEKKSLDRELERQTLPDVLNKVYSTSTNMEGLSCHSPN